MTKLPFFLCIGAQKAGTTWLHHMLRQHPDLFLPETKELSFFDHKRNFEDRGLSWYESNFTAAGNDQRIGEVTPGYLWVWSSSSPDGKNSLSYRKGVPQRVLSVLGNNVKIIVLLRDPVDRGISAYLHHIRKGRIGLDQSILSADRRHGILEMGCYSKQLEIWRGYFHRSNFWIGYYEDVLFSPSKWLKDIFTFLGVDARYEVRSKSEAFNRHFEYRRRGDDIYLTSAPDLIESPVKVVSGAEIEELKKLYEEDVIRLESITGASAPWSRFH